MTRRSLNGWSVKDLAYISKGCDTIEGIVHSRVKVSYWRSNRTNLDSITYRCLSIPDMHASSRSETVDDIACRRVLASESDMFIRKEEKRFMTIQHKKRVKQKKAMMKTIN